MTNKHFFVEELRDLLQRAACADEAVRVRQMAHGAHMALLGVHPELSIQFKRVREEAAKAVDSMMLDAMRSQVENRRRMGGVHAQG